MSEDYEYTISYSLQVELKDVNHQTISNEKHTIAILFQSNGVEALLRKHNSRRKELYLEVDKINTNVQDDVFTLNLQSHREDILSQFNLSNSQRTTIQTNTLKIPLDKIEHRKVKVDLKNVAYDFAPQYGLYGRPLLFPSTVTIEGNLSGIDIETIATKSYHFKNISSSKVYYLNLNKIPSVRVNPSFVALYIPSDEYTEHTISVPVRVISEDTDFEVKVYPETVDVTTFVALQDYEKLKQEKFSVIARFKDTVNGRIPVRLMQFPNFVRVQKVSPQEVQYGIVK